MGPFVLRERLGTLDAAAVAAADLDPIFRERPAIHRFPGAMATRVHELAVHVAGALRRRRGARVDRRRRRPTSCARTSTALPGFGTMKVKALGSVLAKRFGVALAEPLIPWHPTLGDVDSAAGAGGLPGVQEGQQGAGGLTAEHGERALAGLLAVAVGL